MRQLSIAILIAFAGAAVAAPIQTNDIHVLDGDTIRVHHKKPDVRLVGFNAPELAALSAVPKKNWG